MRKLLLSAAVVGLIALSGRAGHAQAVAPGANASRYGIAVVDISYIFQKLPQFKTEMDALKNEVKTADANLKVERDRIVQMEEKRNTLKPGAQDFKQLDEEVARLKADFPIKQGTVRRDVAEKEAASYYKTYIDVTNAVKYFAQQNNIGLVLQFNGAEIDPSRQEAVMRAIMQSVVHQNNIDITPDVLGMMSRGAAAGASSTARAPGTGAVAK